MRYQTVGILLLLTLVPRCLSQNSEPECALRLNQLVASYELEAPSLGAAMLHFSADWNVPLGIEWIESTATSQPIKLTLSNVTGKEVAAQILHSFPEYEAKWRHGVFWVAPRGEEANSSSMLNLIVEDFRAQSVPLGLAQAALYRLISQNIKGAPPYRRETRGGVGSSIGVGLGGLKIVDVHAKNETVRSVVSRLSLSAGTTSWAVTYPQHELRSANGYRRMMTFRDRKIPPDDHQVVVWFQPWEELRKEAPSP